MAEKSTEELKNILGSTHVKNVSSFLNDNKESLIEDAQDFSSYIKEAMKANNRTQQEVFLQADIPERYGYKLISGEKNTKQRDIILRICYAAGMTLADTQKALRLYGLPELYVKRSRDAVLMVCFNEHPGSILDVNAILKQQQMEPLRSCGIQE